MRKALVKVLAIQTIRKESHAREREHEAAVNLHHSQVYDSGG